MYVNSQIGIYCSIFIKFTFSSIFFNKAAAGEGRRLTDGIFNGLGVGGPVGLDDGLEMPMNAVPPTLLGSSLSLKALRPGITARAASFVSRFF